jgi:glycine cleavage system H protein
MDFPNNLLYTKDHEWILFEGDYALIGISDFAQRELGDIVFLDVPSLNQVIEKEAVFGTVEAVKTVSDLYMPITGKVVEVNSQLENMPELVNQSPYESWIIKVQLDAPGDRSGLLTAEQYHSLVL